MLYPFRCKKGHQMEKFLSMNDRNRSQRCERCGGRMERVFGRPVVTGSEIGQTLYEHERKRWNLATGKDFTTSQEIEDWAKESGKQIVGPTYRVPTQVPAHDHEIDKALNDVWEKNHRISYGGEP